MGKIDLAKEPVAVRAETTERPKRSKILLTDGPSLELLEKMREIIKSGKDEGSPTVHVRFHVLVDGTLRRHPKGGINKTPRLAVSLIDIPVHPRLTRQHLKLTTKVVEDFEGGEVQFDGVDIGKAGTELKLTYSFVDRTGEVDNAVAPVVAP